MPWARASHLSLRIHTTLRMHLAKQKPWEFKFKSNTAFMSCVGAYNERLGARGKFTQFNLSEYFHLPDFPHVLSENVYPKCAFARACVFASFNCCRLPKINASTAVSRHHYVVLRLTHLCIAHCHRENEQWAFARWYSKTSHTVVSYVLCAFGRTRIHFALYPVCACVWCIVYG